MPYAASDRQVAFMFPFDVTEYWSIKETSTNCLQIKLVQFSMCSHEVSQNVNILLLNNNNL